MEFIPQTNTKSIGHWLLFCAGMIALMLLIGGITRLTGSGLSITEWEPVMGAIPPLSHADWVERFEKYQQTPEYRHVNSSMTLDQFEFIFWWEYLHRLIGRSIGLIFFVPFCYFAWQRRFTTRQMTRLCALFMLGALQGVVGWLMVKSGLVNDPHVSHFRLMAHLLLAFVLFGATFWQALRYLQLRPDRETSGHLPPFLWRITAALIPLIFIQTGLGAMVAGLKAGYMFNTFPKMGDFWLPPGLWVDTLNNGLAMQFFHRWLAVGVVAAMMMVWLYLRRFRLNKALQRSLRLLLSAVMIQFGLGVLTLLYAVPVVLGVLHQFGALTLFASAIYSTFLLREGSAD